MPAREDDHHALADELFTPAPTRLLIHAGGEVVSVLAGGFPSRARELPPLFPLVRGERDGLENSCFDGLAEPLYLDGELVDDDTRKVIVRGERFVGGREESPGRVRRLGLGGLGVSHGP